MIFLVDLGITLSGGSHVNKIAAKMGRGVSVITNKKNQTVLRVTLPVEHTETSQCIMYFIQSLSNRVQELVCIQPLFNFTAFLNMAWPQHSLIYITALVRKPVTYSDPVLLCTVLCVCVCVCVCVWTCTVSSADKYSVRKYKKAGRNVYAYINSYHIFSIPFRLVTSGRLSWQLSRLSS